MSKEREKARQSSVAKHDFMIELRTHIGITVDFGFESYKASKALKKGREIKTFTSEKIFLLN